MVRRVWKDRIVERPRTYEKIENPDGTITLTPSPGQVIQEGTPVNAENMNNIEQGIEDTQARVDTVQQDLAAHKADFASQEVGKGADMIGLPDPDNLFTATTVGDAMQELFTNVSDGKALVGGAITDVDDSVVMPTGPTFGDLADAIGQISTGKKWASGTVENSDSILTVSGLNFQPSIVLTSAKYQGVEGTYNTEYTIYWGNNPLVRHLDRSVIIVNYYDGSVSRNMYDPITINPNGFVRRVASGGDRYVNWIAFE